MRPPTPATVAGRALSDWSRDGRFGTWHALGPGNGGEPPLGVLRIDRDLLAPQGARQRLAAAVVSVAKLRLPGVPATVDLVAEAGDVWLIVARPPARTVADLLAAGAPGLDEGSAASVLNETAQTLLALHAAGLTHGSLTPDSVVLAPDGTALLVETSLATALVDDPSATSTQLDDITAWAALADRLGTAWAAAGTPAADLFARCSATAESGDLAAARTTLTTGRAALPQDFLRRTALRTAAATALTELMEAARRGTTGGDANGVKGAEGSEGAEGAVRTAADADVADAYVPAPVVPEPDVADAEVADPDVAGPDAADAEVADADVAEPEVADPHVAGPDVAEPEVADPDVPEPDVADAGVADPHVAGPGVADAEATVIGRRGRAAPAAAASDAEATVLGKRNQSIPAPPLTPASAERGDDSEILLRFGPGVPLTEEESLRALWAAPAPAPTRRRRRRRAGLLGGVAVLAAVAVVLWLMLRPSAGPTVTAAEVTTPTRQLSCGQTADVTGVVTTDGRGGPITYRWVRSDGQKSGELTRAARRGEREVTVHLQWTVRGPGLFQGTARLQVLRPTGPPIEAEGTFSYSCA
ncbi:hypothetical protein [Streptomyces sp. NPDC046712]|uniref:hypothetical protein n=1 Tax=Streptomyces sp. NPDC046712 TaxID=3154802 RepID=UPI0033F2A661